MSGDLPLFDHVPPRNSALRIMDQVTMGLMEYAQHRVRCAWHGVTVQRHREHVRATCARMQFEIEARNL